MERNLNLNQLRVLDLLLKHLEELVNSEEHPQFVIKMDKHLIACDCVEFNEYDAVVSKINDQYNPSPISFFPLLSDDLVNKLIEKVLIGINVPTLKMLMNNMAMLMELLLKDSVVNELPGSFIHQPRPSLYKVYDLTSNQKLECLYVDPEQTFEVVSIIKNLYK